MGGVFDSTVDGEDAVNEGELHDPTHRYFRQLVRKATVTGVTLPAAAAARWFATR